MNQSPEPIHQSPPPIVKGGRRRRMRRTHRVKSRRTRRTRRNRNRTRHRRRYRGGSGNPTYLSYATVSKYDNLSKHDSALATPHISQVNRMWH